MSISLVFIVLSMQTCDKLKLLKLQSVASFFYCINLALIQNWIVFITLVVALLRNLVFAYLEHRERQGKGVSKHVGWGIVALFIPVLIVPTIFLWSWWLDWVLVLTSIPVLIGAYIKGTHLMRIGIIFKASFNIVSFIFFFNIVAIVVESIVLTSIFVFYIRFFIGKHKGEVSLNKVEEENFAIITEADETEDEKMNPLQIILTNEGER